MCITAECPDPTEPGVWWREDHCWIKYSPEHTKLIKQAVAAQETTVSLGVIKSTVHPRGNSYVVNLQTMAQSNVHSGYQRSIKIVLELPDDDEDEEKPEKSWIGFFVGLVSKVVPCMKDNTSMNRGSLSMNPKVYYKTKEGGMQPYSDEIARQIILWAAAGVESVSFVTATNEDVVVNLEKMKETQHSGGEIAPEVKIELPWKPSALDNATMDDKKTLQKKLIAALLDGLMDHNLLQKAIREKFNPMKKAKVKRVSANPYMQKDSNGAKLKFVDALCKTAADNNKIIGEILDTLKEKNIGKLQSLNIVFHGTPSRNIEKILKLGLDPKRSRHPVFYVALKPETSMGFADRKVVVLLELKAPSVPEEDWQQDIHTIPIAQPELLLPIATAVYSKYF